MECKKIIFIILNLITINSFAQEIKLSNSSKSHVISEKDLVEIFIGDIDKDSKICCSFKEVLGNIEEVKKDSIVFNISQLIYKKSFSQEGNEMTYDWSTISNIQVIAKDDIMQLRNYGSFEKKKFRKNLSITGGVLFFGGLLTSANALIFQKKEDRGKLLLIGGIQAGAGFIFGMTSTTRKYPFKSNDDPWKFN